MFRGGSKARALAIVVSGALAVVLALPPAAAEPAGAPPGQAASDAGAARSAPTPRPQPSPAPVLTTDNSATAAPTPDVYADTDPSALTYFRPTLDPYGSWIESPVYGVVWVPDPRYAGADFAPYVTSGYWALTTRGDWVWVSDFSWGWVVFHYGRWVWISGTGWAWIPGRRYASAWVVWRLPDPGYYYVGWAPMPPDFVWFGGVAFVLHHRPPLPFVFCHSRWLFRHSLRHHLVPRSHVRFAAAHTQRYHRPARSPRMGPPLSRAHVPASAVPRTRVAPSPKAVLAARHSTSTRVRQPRFSPARPAPARPGRALPARPGTPRMAPPRRSVPRSVPRSAPPRRAAPQGAAPRQRAAPPQRAAPRAAPKAGTKSRGRRAPPRRAPPRAPAERKRGR